MRREEQRKEIDKLEDDVNEKNQCISQKLTVHVKNSDNTLNVLKECEEERRTDEKEGG